MNGQLTLSLEHHRLTGINAVAQMDPYMQCRLITAMRSKNQSTVYALNEGCTLTWLGRGIKPVFVQEFMSNGGQLSDLACCLDQIEALPA